LPFFCFNEGGCVKKADIIAGIIGITIGAYVIVKGLGFPEDHVMKIGPSFFPNFLASGLIICSLVLLIKALLGQSIGEYNPITWSNMGIRRICVAIIYIVVYCAVLKTIGFIIASVLFVILFMRMFGKQKIWKYAVYPFAITGGVYLVFEILLKLTLPAGLLSSIL
jgi:putative tricarboxylic transport membrane protein